jgi:hypothetical protein
VRVGRVENGVRRGGAVDPFEVEIALAKLKRYKSPGSDQIPAELIQAGGEISRSKIHKLITYIWHKKKLPDQSKESVIVPVHKKDDDGNHLPK